MFDRLKAFLSTPEIKSSRTARLVAFENGGRARWTPRDYTGLAREGYLANAIVHRSVRLIAENAAACQYLVFEGAAERDAHPLAQLLSRPNPRQDGGVFFEMLYAHLLLAGNAYVEAVALGDSIRELYALRPDRMKVVPGADGWAEAYEYSVGGRSVRFDQLASPVPPILHLTFFHPLDDHYGLAPIEAAAVAVDLRSLSLDNAPHVGINTTASSPNLLSVKSNAALLSAINVADGGSGDARLQISKESAAKTASVFFSDAFSGRAEFGLTGDDNFHLKVSADGSTWSDAFTIDKTTGKIALQGFSDAVASRALLYAAPFDALAYNGLQINGGMEVSQENGASPITGIGDNVYIVDGWKLSRGGPAVINAQQVADAPSGVADSIKITVTTAEASIAAGSYYTITQQIEGYRASRLAFGSANAQPVSIGFWTKIHRVGVYSGAVSNGQGSRCCPFSFTQNVADTWEYKTVSIPGDVTGSWLGTTNNGLQIVFVPAVGATYQGTAGAWSSSNLLGVTGTTNGIAATTDVFQITGVVVVPGLDLPASGRSALVLRPYDQELAICQRYYQPFGADDAFEYFGAGKANSTTSARIFMPLKARMRLAPALAVSSASHFGSACQAGLIVASGVAIDRATPDNVGLVITTAGSMVAGEGVMLQANNTTSAKLSYSARL